MAYLPKRMVEENIRTRTRKGRDGRTHTDFEAYLGVDPFDRKPVRITRADMDELLAALKDFYQRHQVGGDAAVRLTAMQAIDAKGALDALANAGMNVTLTEAVMAYIGGLAVAKVNCERTVHDVYLEYVKKKYGGFPRKLPSGIRDPDDVNADRDSAIAKVGKWAETFGARKLASITAKDVADYLEANYGKRKPKTYNSHLLYLKVFFNWCCKDEREYLVKSPIRSLEDKPEPWEEPEYMKPEDVEKLFRLLEAHKSDRPEFLAYAIVNFFCGCRAVEVRRMASDPDAAKIDIENATVRLAKGKGFQQGKKPRAFTIHPTALAWMKSFRFADALKKVTKDTQEEIYDLARANGVPMFQNCGRHTFITYHVAAYGDPAKTTAMVGTSDKMRADNYCGLATKKDGEAYFAIMPTAN